MTTPAITAFETLGSRNLELQNALLSHQVLSAFIGNVEYMQNQLLVKMNDDRSRTDTLKERLVWQQNLARQVKDPEKDDKTHAFVISYDGSTTPPFVGWVALLNKDNAPNYGDLTAAQANDIMAKGTIWVPSGSEKLSGKQIYAYYDQQAEATKSAISALNAVTSQDNLTLQSLRSKVDSNTQLLSTIIKNEKDRKEGVMRNM